MRTECKISCVMAITIATNDECVSRKSIKRPWWDLQCLSTTLWLTCRPGWQWQCTTYPILIDISYIYYVGHDDFQGGAWVWRYVSFFGAHLTLHRLSGIKMYSFWWSWTASCEAWKIFLISFHPFSTHGRPCPPVTTAFTSAIVIPKRAQPHKTGPATRVGHNNAFKTIVDAAALTILPFVSHPGSVALRHCEPEMILEKFLPGRGALTMTKIFDNDQDLWQWPRSFDNDQDLWQWPRSCR